MKQRLKLLRALEKGTLTKEQEEHIKQFPHMYEKSVKKVTKKGRKK